MILTKVVSGGQTGADVAGVKAAKACGLQTGGWVPFGFQTENGPQPNLGDEYGLVETESTSYVTRTFQNVHDSEGTLRFAINFGSAGEVCTLNAIKEFHRPYQDIVVDLEFDVPMPFEAVADWVEEHGITVLNVAGHRESSCPGIGNYVETFITQLIKVLKERENDS